MEHVIAGDGVCCGVLLRKDECERVRLEKAEAERELTRVKSMTTLDPSKSDLSGHPQFQRVRLSPCSSCLLPLALKSNRHWRIRLV